MTALAFLLSEGVKADLLARSYPVEVVYGPERLPRSATHAGLAVLFTRDRKGTDPIGAPVGSRSNPHYEYIRGTAIEVRVYAQSGEAGARNEEHEALAEVLVDAVLTAVRRWCLANRRGEPTWQSARFMAADELEKEEQWQGVVYQIRLTVMRAVVDVDFFGSGLPEGVISKLASRTEARYTGNTAAAPAIGCDTTGV